LYSRCAFFEASQSNIITGIETILNIVDFLNPSFCSVGLTFPITADGKLYVHIQDKAFKGETIVQFLKHLLRQIAGQLLIIWDGLPAHRGKAIKDFLRAGATKRIHLERLPGYAPDLNPIEGVWQYLKYVEMKNLCCHTLDELRYELRKAIARLRHKTDIICSCIEHLHLGQYL